MCKKMMFEKKKEKKIKKISLGYMTIGTLVFLLAYFLATGWYYM
jgi:hypothetical protein